MKENMKVKKIIMIMMLSISMMFGLLTIENQATNQTEEESNTTTQNITNTQATQNTSSTNNKVVEKSSNANLSNLGIRPHDFTGFRYGTTSYEVAVPEDTQEVEVYASAQDEKATVTGTGKKSLEKGENKIQVVVTAEDGTTKTYTINIIREVQQESYKEIEEIRNQESGNGLAELKIGDLSLSPEFKTNVYEYTVKYIGEDVRLKIEAKPTEEDYIVEIIGNDNLQEGENYITILVSEENGDNVATYQITVNKSLIDEEAIAKEEALKKANQQKIIIGIAIVVVAIIVIIVIVKRKKNIKLEEAFSGRNPYDRIYEEEDFDEEEVEEKVPRALRGKRFYEEEEQEENEIENDELEKDFEDMSKDELKKQFLKGYDFRRKF
ncbi:MAG: cadherin-like beta sandwich domain-containing protein [Clostridia bacterium]|nr:cadherin-like beta sandwich domain-containing protein [Clostridia bacterium]